VKEKIPFIKLLTPNGTPKGIKETEHKSLWLQKDISQLLVHEKYMQIIEGLIKNDQWIKEASNHLIEMLKTRIFQTLR
jgi:hypothetical protein